MPNTCSWKESPPPTPYPVTYRLISKRTLRSGRGGSHPPEWYGERIEPSRYIVKGGGGGEEGASADVGAGTGGTNAMDVMDKYMLILLWYIRLDK